MKSLISGAAALGLLAVVPMASAAEFGRSIRPADLGTAPGGVGAVAGYGYDGTRVVGDESTGAPGFGSTSVAANIPSGYSEIQFDLGTIFGRPVTIGDLDQISYSTKNNTSTVQDWTLRIYTPRLNGVASQFYEYRFENLNPAPSGGNWDAHDTSTPGGEIYRAFYRPDNTFVSTPTTSLDDLDTVYNLGGKGILYVSLIAGAQGNTTAISTNLDGVVFRLDNGDLATINFVPEPTSLSLLGFAALPMLRRRRAATA